MSHEDLIISLMEARKLGRTIEYFNYLSNSWDDMLGDDYEFPPEYKYRIKPEPVKPREWWLHDGRAHGSEGHAVNSRAVLGSRYPIIRVREVMENDE